MTAFLSITTIHPTSPSLLPMHVETSLVYGENLLLSLLVISSLSCLLRHEKEESQLEGEEGSRKEIHLLHQIVRHTTITPNQSATINRPLLLLHHYSI